MKIGITGPTGFLGTYLLDYLTRNTNYILQALTRTLSPLNTDDDRVKWLRGDLGSLQSCEDFVRDLDAIIHLAHTNTPLDSNHFLPDEATLNLIPTLNLLQAIKQRRRGIHLIYASSGGAIYGFSAIRQPFRESDLCLPQSSYGIQKLVAEQYLRLWAQKKYLTATVLRISNPYGTLLPSARRQGLIGVALSQIINDQPVNIYGSPENVRDYIHLEDMSRIFEVCLEKRNGFEIFNVGTGVGHSVNDILLLLEEFCSRKVRRELVRTQFQLDDASLPDWAVLDASKANRELSWKAKTSLEDGLKAMCQGVLSKEFLKLHFLQARQGSITG
jgi:UDP-glucose 4-epimerase